MRTLMTRVSIGVADRLSKGGGRASSRDATSGLRRGYLRRSDTPLCFQMDLFPRPGRGNSCTPLAINLDRSHCLRPCATVIRMYSIYHISGALAAVTLSPQCPSTLPHRRLDVHCVWLIIEEADSATHHGG